ncbi:polysaccharide biosynthesis protein [Enterococcus florum]|uniref:Polysaccharide biosynthesis protein n=1 Tax=Enterococcus florum TaxID=2480627 RepID=A0A4P5PD19_9ENTE|nr:polysaccharide biosynthesis protein [Enterococcus florum]GCF94221.1 polysaccharide biosynthesis protein [Enterococcus florum]
MKKNLLSGTFWLSSASILCKVLGIVYLIPWLMMMGSQKSGLEAQALYNVAYLPYALFLTLGTAGFPSGIAKQIATERENRQRVGELFKSSVAVMEVIGVVSALLMFIFAPWLSRVSPVSDVAQATWAIRSLCPSLLVIPILSAMRGYFQGMSDMVPYSVSQVLEQFIRVIVILAGTFYFRVLTDGSVFAAVIISTMASCFGGVISILYLMKVGKRKNYFRLRYFVVRPNSLLRGRRAIVVSIIKESLPFIYVGAAISLSQLIDQVTLKTILHTVLGKLNTKEVEVLYTQASANPNKLTVLLLSVVNSVAVTSLPLLVSVNRTEELMKSIADILRLSLTFLLPASLGMIVLAEPMYTIFFGYDPSTTGYMLLAVLATVACCGFSVVFAILQALGFHRKSMRLVTKGLLLKFALQLPLVAWLQGYGLHLATIGAFSFMTIRGYRFLCQEFAIRPLRYVRDYLKRITIATVVMGIICRVCYQILAAHLVMSQRMQAFLVCAVVALIGTLVYSLLGLPEQLKRAKRTLNGNQKSKKVPSDLDK